MPSLEYITKAPLKNNTVYICSSLSCKIFKWIWLLYQKGGVESQIHFNPTTADGPGPAQLTSLAYYQTIYWVWWPLIHNNTFSTVFYRVLGFNRKVPRVSGEKDRVNRR